MTDEQIVIQLSSPPMIAAVCTYDVVDPDNRLVAAELEQRWEQALRALKAAEEQAQAHRPSRNTSPCLLTRSAAALLDLGQQLPTIWESDVLSRAQKKPLLRCLIDKVVVHRPLPDHVHTRIVWRGGETTTSTFLSPSILSSTCRALGDWSNGRWRCMPLGSVTGRSPSASPSRATAHPAVTVYLRVRSGAFASVPRIFLERSPSHPGRPDGYLSVADVAEQLGVTQQWLTTTFMPVTSTSSGTRPPSCISFRTIPIPWCSYSSSSSANVKSFICSRSITMSDRFLSFVDGCLPTWHVLRESKVSSVHQD